MFTKEIATIPYHLCSPLGDILGDLLLAGEAPTPAEVGLLLCHWHQVGCVHCCVYHLVHIIALKVTLFSQHIKCSYKNTNTNTNTNISILVHVVTFLSKHTEASRCSGFVGQAVPTRTNRTKATSIIVWSPLNISHNSEKEEVTTTDKLVKLLTCDIPSDPPWTKAHFLWK